MEHVATGLAAFAERLRARAMDAEREHAERMASLPKGTCERCYGVGMVGPSKCPDCNTSVDDVYAVGVPYEFQSAAMANYLIADGNKTALAKAEAFIKGNRDLYLTGGVGAGKTRLACSIINDLFRKGKSARFARVPMLLHQLQPGRSAEDIAEIERQMFTAGVLVLDDIGAERDMATDYTRRTLLMIYEERGDRGLRTIFTSNKTLAELGQMQDDDRLSSRIAGRADAVKLTVPDQRMQQARSRR
jgi:DNA replication protein DnaC